MDFQHTSVLLSESVEFLITDRNGVYVDCTMGGAGHSCGFAGQLKQGGMIVGIDQDEDAIAAASARLLGGYECRILVAKGNFSNFSSILDDFNIGSIDGIFFDLGVSSYQLDNAARGFSYMQDGPLDMRMDLSSEFTAAVVVNTYSEEALSDLLHRYGEERWSKRIAQFIAAARKEKEITSTLELVNIIKKAVPKSARKDGPHPAKRTFQAIRIEVNNELRILEDTMYAAVDRLKSGGRIGVITFHSLEDRIIKQTFAKLAKGCECPPRFPVCVCGKRPLLKNVGNIVPSMEEISVNPRSRSARLRYAVKV